MLREVMIPGIKGEVLVKTIKASREVWDKLLNSQNPFRQEYNFENDQNMIEVPLNDFFGESCYGEMTFFAEEINAALSDGAELLWVKKFKG